MSMDIQWDLNLTTPGTDEAPGISFMLPAHDKNCIIMLKRIFTIREHSKCKKGANGLQ